MTDELTALLKESVARFNAMPPEEQRAMREAQRRSYLRGELMMEHPEMTKDEADRLIEKALGR